MTTIPAPSQLQTQPQPLPVVGQAAKLTPGGQVANGAVSMTLSLAVTQPLFFAKTIMQTPGTGSFLQRMKTALTENSGKSPHKVLQLQRLWAGFGANATGGALAEGIAFGVHELGVNWLKSKGKQLTDTQDLGVSCVSSIGGAPGNASTERAMIRQQLGGGSLVPHMKAILKEEGARGLFKGTAVTIGRDSFYNVGVFALFNIAKKIVSPVIQDPLKRDVTAGMLAGAVAGACSNPFDLVKTRLQGDTTNTHTTAWKTAMKIVQQEGVKGLFVGTTARMATIGPLISLTATLKERIPAYLPSQLQVK